MSRQLFHRFGSSLFITLCPVHPLVYCYLLERILKHNYGGEVSLTLPEWPPHIGCPPTSLSAKTTRICAFGFSTWFSVSLDAAGALGYGALFNREWFVGIWSASQQPSYFAYWKIFPVVISAVLWDRQWGTNWLEFCSENMAVGGVLHSGTSKDPNMMVLLCHLSLSAARHSFAFTASHTAGRDNSIADALSAFDFQHFHHPAPHAANVATPIPPSLLAQLPVTWQQNASSTYPMVLHPSIGKSVALLNTSSWTSVVRIFPVIQVTPFFLPVNKRWCNSVHTLQIVFISHH